MCGGEEPEIKALNEQIDLRTSLLFKIIPLPEPYKKKGINEIAVV